MNTLLHRPSRTAVRISLATAFSLLGDQVLYSVLPVHFQSFGLLPYQVGVLLSANRWIRLLTNRLAHRAHQRVPASLLFPAAMALGVATTLMYTRTSSFAWLLLARLLWGLAWSFIRHVGVLAIMSEVTAERAGQTMGYYNGIARLGAVGGLFGGALLVETAGFAPAIVMLAGISLMSIPLSLGVRHIVDEEPSEISHSGTQGRDATLLALGFSLGAVGPGFVMSTLGHVLQSQLGAGIDLMGFHLGVATFTGALLAVRFVLDSVGAPVLGALGDRFGLRFTGVLFFALGAAALSLATTAQGIGTLTPAVIAFFLCSTALTAAVSGAAAQRGSEVYSRYVTAGDIGAATGPLLGWIAMELVDSPVLGLALGAGFYALAAAISATFLRRRARPSA